MKDSLFKFFPYNSHDLDALANNYLWFSHYYDFNDPFEDVFINNAISMDKYDFDERKAIEFYKVLHANMIPSHQLERQLLEQKIDGTFREKYQSMMDSTFKGALSDLKYFVENSKATCFARDHKNSKAIKNKLMWSHYANGLRGFCIEYDREKLISGISELIGDEIDVAPMQYGQLRRFSFQDLMMSTAKRASLGGEYFSVGSLVHLKSSEWEYENEYRLITTGDNCVPIRASSICSVTVGSKMTKSRLNTLLSILNGNSEICCEVYETYIDLETFDLERRFLTTIGK
ncbi:DUF2971 domain-containing protein [Vibrio cholerae]